MNILDKIILQKKKEVEKIRHLSEKMRISSLARDDFRSLKFSLKDKDEISVLAEVKKASPSAGDIVDNFDPIKIAKEYEEGGASAISVLTDKEFFKGNLSFLKDIRNITSIPLLRKDFIIDEVQIYESILAGADAILLICACLSKENLLNLHELALNYQLEVLVEVHTLEELDTALNIKDLAIIGINNRNLNNFKVDLNTSIDLSSQVDDDIVLISESGIRNAEDATKLFKNGVDAVLVGETLMRSTSKKNLIEELSISENLERTKNKVQDNLRDR